MSFGGGGWRRRGLPGLPEELSGSALVALGEGARAPRQGAASRSFSTRYVTYVRSRMVTDVLLR